VKEECLSRLILFGESSLRRALQQYLVHYHEERNHQGKENLILFPTQTEVKRKREGVVRCRERASWPPEVLRAGGGVGVEAGTAGLMYGNLIYIYYIRMRADWPKQRSSAPDLS
jgi:hypothetical protein